MDGDKTIPHQSGEKKASGLNPSGSGDAGTAKLIYLGVLLIFLRASHRFKVLQALAGSARVDSDAATGGRPGAMPSSMREWLRLPSRIALLLGLGALSVAGAKADPTAEADRGNAASRVPQQSAKTFGELLIWSENGRIYTSEAGRAAEELHLAQSAEVDALHQLLRQAGATATTPHALRDGVILVGAGGAGLHWEATPADQASKPQTPPKNNSGRLGGTKPADGSAAQPPVTADASKK